MVLTLYYNIISQPARSVVAFLNLTSVKFETKLTYPARGDTQTVEFKKLNPLSQIPVMTEGDFVLREAEAIIKYVMDTRKVGEEYYPKDAKTRALINRYMVFHHDTLRPKLIAAFSFCLLPGRFPGDENQISNGVEQACELFTKYFLGDKKYIVGDHLTIADIFAFHEFITISETTGFDFDGFPEIKEFMKRCLENPVLKELNEPVEMFGRARKNAGCLAKPQKLE